MRAAAAAWALAAAACVQVTASEAGIGGAAAGSQVVLSDLPGSGFPGHTAEASNASWPSGHQPKRLEAWPSSFSATTGKRTLLPCWKVTPLQDAATGWPGKCLRLFHAAQIDGKGAEVCKKVCSEEPRCPSWQYTNATSTGPLSPSQCWVGFGENCVNRGGDSQQVTVEGAQRLMHGEVKVLMNLSGWKINNLYQMDMSNEGNMDVSILRCKAWCYSSIHCEYWQYGPGGCWVDAPWWTTSKGTYPEKKVQYPLTTNGGATNATPEAQQMMWGEYLQHYCPSPDDSTTSRPVEVSMPALGLGAAEPEQVDLPWWVWLLAAFAGACVLLAVACYLCVRRGGGKKATRSTGPSARGLAGDYDEEDSPLVAKGGAHGSRSSASSSGGSGDDFDDVPPPPPWRPPDAATAGGRQQPLGSSGKRQPLGSTGRSFPQHFAPPTTQLLNQMQPSRPGTQMMPQYGHAPPTQHAGSVPFPSPSYAHAAYGHPGWRG